MEIWKPIANFDRYEISNMGSVRNLGGQLAACGKPGGFRVVPAKTIKPFVVKSTGYMQVLLPDRRKHLVHRLVAFAFHGDPPAGMVVNHINGIRNDNRAENLEWVSHSYNLRHPKAALGKRSRHLGRRSTETNKITAVVATNPLTGQVLNFACASDAVRDHGFDSGSISRCCYGLAKHHKGWTFRFADGVNGFPHKSRTSLGRDVPDLEDHTR